MKLKTRSILQELNDFGNHRDKDRIIESRAVNVINSAVNLIESLRTHYDSETADELERRLINSIKGQDSNKFKRGMKKVIESKER